MHEDYSRRQLQKITTGPDNHQLIHSVDPFTYRSNLTMPKLIISGSNDPFWLSNSSDYFRHELPGQTNHLLIPNAGHEMGDGTMTFVALGAFADHLRANSILPRLDFNISNDKLIVTYTHKPKSLKVWQAESENLWFSDQCFTQICISTDAMEAETTFNLASNSKNQAIFVEAIFSNLSEDYSLSTPMKIYKKQT